MDKIVSRVRIDLSDFFRDERKSCLKSLDYNALIKVSDLKNYIVTEMGILGQTQLMLGNSILLSSDDLRVIRDGDELKLVSCDFSRSCSGSKRNVLTEPADEHLESEDSSSAMSVDSSANIKVTYVPSLQKQAEENFNKTVLEEGLEWMKDPLPKRKRPRRGRNKRRTAETNHENGHVAAQKNKKYEPPKRSMVGTTADQKNHIRFDEKAEGADEDLQSNGLNPPAQNGSEDQSQKTAVKENAAPGPVVFKRDFRKEAAKTENCYDALSDQELFDMPSASSAPSMEEILAFRILFINEKCVPELSGWLIGKVVNIDGVVVRLQLLRGINPKYQVEHEVFGINEDKEPEEEEFLTISFSELITPRLVP